MSLLIPAALSQPTAPSYTPKAYEMNNPSEAYLTLPEAGHTLTNAGDGFTVVMFFEVPNVDFPVANHTYLLNTTSTFLRFEAFSGTTARKLFFSFIDLGFAYIWRATSVTDFTKGQKYCLAMSYRVSDNRKQFYVNGVSEAPTGDVGVGGTPWLDLDWQIGTEGSTYWNLRVSHFWMTDTSIDLDANIGNFVTGGTTPVDNSNSCKIYMKMDDLDNDGSDSFTAGTPNGTPNNANW